MQYVDVFVAPQVIDELMKKGVVHHPVDNMASNQPVIVRNNTNPKLSILAKYRRAKLYTFKLDPFYTFEPKNKEQQYIWDACWDPEILMIISSGGAGTGKTFPAVAYGLYEILENKSKRYEGLTIVKPNAKVGDTLGFVKGDLDTKMDPIMQSFYDPIRKVVKHNSIIDMMKSRGILEVMPIEYARGRTIENRIVIFDEFQNTDYHESRTLLSRLVESCKVFILGDETQRDRRLPTGSQDGLMITRGALLGEDWIAGIRMDNEKNLRGIISKTVLQKWSQFQPKN